MKFYEKLEKYLERGFHVLVKDNEDDTFVLISPFENGPRCSRWSEDSADCLESIGASGTYPATFWNDNTFEIVRTYTPEQLNPKFKRYEEGDKVVCADGVWIVTRVFGNGTYNIERLEDGYLLTGINHYDLKPYIEEEGLTEGLTQEPKGVDDYKRGREDMFNFRWVANFTCRSKSAKPADLRDFN